MNDHYPDEWDEPVFLAFCDHYQRHEDHFYMALNANTYHCPGLTDRDIQDIVADAARPPCEHGLSASLCAGPDHYPPDDH